MTTLSTDVQAMLRACHADDSDDVRLLLADALDEAPTRRVPCEDCFGKGGHAIGDHHRPDCEWRDCVSCSRTGTVVDRGDADRAELIRVQVELGRTPEKETATLEWADGHLSREALPNPAHGRLVRRERELLAANPSWLTHLCPEESRGHQSRSSSHHCPVCWAAGDLFRQLEFNDGRGIVRNKSIATLDRGLVVLRADKERCWEEVRVKCVACRGDGILTRFHGPGATNPYRDLCGKCTDGRVTETRPTLWLRAVAACPWVTRVENTVVPFLAANWYTFWDESQLHAAQGLVPKPVFDQMWEVHPEAKEDNETIGRWMRFDTAEAATRALGSAVVLLARAPKQE